MDTSEYMPMFLAETGEHLQELNLAVVRLEDNPEDRATVDEIFRIASRVSVLKDGAMVATLATTDADSCAGARTCQTRSSVSCFD